MKNEECMIQCFVLLNIYYYNIIILSLTVQKIRLKVCGPLIWLWVPMGSVLALSNRPGRQNFPFSQDRPLSRWDRRDGRLPNPGSFDGLHRNCKGLILFSISVDFFYAFLIN